MPPPSLLVPGKLLNHENDIPIEFITNWLKKRMPEFGGGKPTTLADRVLIVKSRTGSGKSTVLPVYVFRLLRNEKSSIRQVYTGRSVLCTQPRVLTAMTLARDLGNSAHYPDMMMGITIGFQTGPISERPPRGLVYATAGVLLAQLRFRGDDEIIGKYAFIIVDEVHERSLDTDAVLMKLKQFLVRNMGNPRLPFLILTSATIDVNKYAKYFKLPSENTLEVEGRAFSIEIRWPSHGCNDYPLAAAEAAAKIHTENPTDPPERADILIFMPGSTEIRLVVENLEKINKTLLQEKKLPMMVLAVDREVVNQEAIEYKLLRESPDKLWMYDVDKNRIHPGRRVIISTVVAETGLTIETLKYVIDPGWNRAIETYQPFNVTGLITRPEAQSRAEQRKGRAGRLFPGIYIPLFTQNVYAQLLPQQLPDIVTEGPAAIFLDVVKEQLSAAKQAAAPGTLDVKLLEFRVENIDLLDPPPTDALSSTIELALLHGFLSDDVQITNSRQEVIGTGWGLTRVGEIIARFSQIDFSEARLIVSGYFWNLAITDIVTIIAITRTAERGLNGLVVKKRAEPVLETALYAGLPPYLSKFDYYKTKLLLSDDLLEGLYIFEGFCKAVKKIGLDLIQLNIWCDQHGLQIQHMLSIVRAREDILTEMLVAGLNPFWNHQNRLVDVSTDNFMNTIVRFKRCFYEAWQLNLLIYNETKSTYITRFNLEVKVPPIFTDLTVRKLKTLEIKLHRPKYIITPKILLIQNSRSENLMWYLESPLIVVLDGYVDPDLTFSTPRWMQNKK
jgi:HrpA-like RNA helicase